MNLMRKTAVLMCRTKRNVTTNDAGEQLDTSLRAQYPRPLPDSWSGGAVGIFARDCCILSGRTGNPPSWEILLMKERNGRYYKYPLSPSPIRDHSLWLEKF